MRTRTVRTGMMIRTWSAMLLATSLVLAACGGDDGDGGDSSDSGVSADSDNAEGDNAEGDNAEGDNAEGDNSSGGDDSSEDGDAVPSPSGGTVIFGGEEISMQPLLCYFQEQPRAGLGGIFTHSAQAQGTNAAGEAVLLDTTRAVAEDGTVEYDLTFGVGDPFGDEYAEYFYTGQEVMFGDNSVSASGDVDDFESGPTTLTFDLPCG